MAHGQDVGRVLGGRYELRRRLGSGGAGAVWEGYDRSLDRPVAIKLLHGDLADDPAVEARFRTEATAAARLSHPNAVLVYDVGHEDGADYLVMELVVGTTLATLLAEGPLSSAEAATTGTMVASALGAAHRAGIIHRDVKPGNVLLTEHGQAKLADFGIARALGDLTSRLTRTGMVLGTARYLAPEQLRDDPLDARADVYALGLVLHEALTGQPPFGDGGAVEVAARRLTVELPPIGDFVDGVPPELVEVVRWATARDPRERPADGDRLAAALRPFVDIGADGGLARRIAVPIPRDELPARASGPDADAADERAHGATQAIGLVAATPDAPASATPPDAGQTAALSASAPSSDATDTPSAPAAGGGRSAGSRGARWVGGLLAAAALVAVVTVIGLGRGENGGGDVAGGEDVAGGGDVADGGTDDGTESPTGEIDTLAIADAGDHDPLGDGDERPEDVPRAIDGDADSAWPTQTYTTTDLGGLKDGVGMWVQLEEPASIDRVEVTLVGDGGELDLWAGDGPPDTDQAPDDWGELVGRGTITDTDVRFPLDDRDVTTDTVLLWFTELPSVGDGFRAEVRDVRIYGR